MRADAYAAMHAMEGEHWWFVGRRRIIERVIRRFAPPGPLRILEAGCGTGGNFKMLAAFGTVTAFEPDAAARAMAKAVGAATVEEGALPGPLGLPGPFDLICALDVIEHLEADEASCRALAERLGPEGVGVFTVPAFGFLWSQHDVILHHHRRYGRAGFNAMLRRAGLEVVYSSYFNAILFPAVAAARLAQRLLRLRSEHDDTAALPPRPVNALLGAVFAAERLAIPALRLPFGVSIVSVVRRAA